MLNIDIYLSRIIHKAQYKIVKSEQYYSKSKEGYENGNCMDILKYRGVNKIKHSL
jgi:hypothetical protein